MSLASTAYSDRRNALFTSPEYALSATNPENGTVTYTYNSDHTLHTKTDAKSQVFTYSYDSYKRLTQIMVGSTVLRTFMYDTNTLDSMFSGSYTQGRLVAVQNSHSRRKATCRDKAAATSPSPATSSSSRCSSTRNPAW